MIGTAVVTITLSVRQGSLTSCLLFIMFVNDLIKGCEIDGFLAWVHILVLMDDSVFLSTFRGNMIKKITLLRNYCKENGMKIS